MTVKELITLLEKADGGALVKDRANEGDALSVAVEYYPNKKTIVLIEFKD